MAKDDLSKVKSQVKDLEVDTDEISIADEVEHDPETRGAAQQAIKKLQTLAERKMAAGFVLRRVPILNGYKEVWVIP